MNKGFRIIISLLLILTMAVVGLLCAAYYFYAVTYIHNDAYGVAVAGVQITRENCDDVLGDGTVSYNPTLNTLTLDNACIVTDYSAIYSVIDLQMVLVGENTITCKDNDYIPAIYAAQHNLYKDLAIVGDGSLTISFQNTTGDVLGIAARDLLIESDVTVATPDASGIVNGVYCTSSLHLMAGARLTVVNGAGQYSTALAVRGNVHLANDASLTVTAHPATAETCRGLNIDGDLILAENASVSVSLEDASTSTSRCMYVSGLIQMAANATVSASSERTYAIECYGAMKLGDGASVVATTKGEGADIFCAGAIVNGGATVTAEVDAIGGIRNESEKSLQGE